MSDLFSAQVIVEPPSQSDADTASRSFKSAGFDVGPLRAGGFAISAPIRTFESYFAVSAQHGRAPPFSGNELPVAGLPPTLRKHIARVVFTPLAFGPAGDF